jgi:hypothetical protein
MFNLKPGIEDSDRDDLFAQMMKLSEIPGVLTLSIGKVLQARDEGYREKISTEFSHALLVDFADEDGLETYQNEPYHVHVAAEIRKRVDSIKVTDFVTPA